MIIQHSRIKEDSALGIIISVFFGFGIVLLTYIQHNGTGNQSGLDDFIFGQAASMVAADVNLIAVISLILLSITAIFYKEFKLLTFDPQFAKGIGITIAYCLCSSDWSANSRCCFNGCNAYYTRNQCSILDR
jgi:manganese/zinc/iron transport system permease protein